MDKIMKITSGLFIVILVIFVSVVAYNMFVENSYRSSLTGTFIYNFTLTTDSQLSNVSLFIPVPEDMNESSPIISQYSTQSIDGMPSDWNTTLYDSGKVTMVRITTSSITPPAGTTTSQPYTITLSANLSASETVETADPVGNGVMFRPVESLQSVSCQGTTGQCYQYTIPLDVDYTTVPNATVSISSTIIGKNTWVIFKPESNEFHSAFNVVLVGTHHGWATANGDLETGIGSYDAPAHTS